MLVQYLEVPWPVGGYMGSISEMDVEFYFARSMWLGLILEHCKLSMIEIITTKMIMI